MAQELTPSMIFHFSIYTIINISSQTEVKLCVKNILLFSAPAAAVAVPHIIDTVTHHLNR